MDSVINLLSTESVKFQAGTGDWYSATDVLSNTFENVRAESDSASLRIYHTSVTGASAEIAVTEIPAEYHGWPMRGFAWVNSETSGVVTVDVTYVSGGVSTTVSTPTNVIAGQWTLLSAQHEAIPHDTSTLAMKIATTGVAVGGGEIITLSEHTALKRWHEEFARVKEALTLGDESPATTDVLWVGDSIGEGWSTNDSDITMVNIFTSEIAKVLNNQNRFGKWVPAGGDWYTLPRFTNNVGSTLYSNHIVLGEGVGAYFADDKVYLSESFASSNFLDSGVGQIVQLYIGAARFSWTGKESGAGGRTVLTGVDILSYFFYSGTTLSAGSTVSTGGSDTIVRGLGLRSRSLTPMTTYDPANAYFTTTLTGAITTTGQTAISVADASNIPATSVIRVGTEIMEVTAKSGNDLTVLRGRYFTTAGTHSNGATVTIQKLNITGESTSLDFTGDNIAVHYRLQNLFGSGRIKFDLYRKNTSTGNYDILVVSSGSITTITGTVPAYGHKLAEWDANTACIAASLPKLTRDDYRLTVSQFSPNTVSNNGTVLFDGAYFFDGNTDQGVRVWNSSKFGANFNTFNSIVNISANTDWLSALRNALVDPSLVVIALGTNELPTTDGLVGGPSNASVVEARIREMVEDIKAAYAVGFPNNPLPSFAFFVPPADSSTSSTDWDLIQARYELVAQDIDAAIWDWAGFTGDVNFTYALVGNLKDAINASTTTIVTSATPKNVAIGDTLLIDDEKVYVSGISGASLTVQRGYSATSNVSHVKSRRVFNFDLEIGTGDPEGWTADYIHPNVSGHESIGLFAASEALAAVDVGNVYNKSLYVSRPAIMSPRAAVQSVAGGEVWLGLPEYLQATDKNQTDPDVPLFRFIETLFNLANSVDLTWQDFRWIPPEDNGRVIKESGLVSPNAALAPALAWMAQIIGSSLIDPTSPYTPWLFLDGDNNPLTSLTPTWAAFVEALDKAPDDGNLSWEEIQNYNPALFDLTTAFRAQVNGAFYGYKAGTTQSIINAAKTVIGVSSVTVIPNYLSDPFRIGVQIQGSAVLAEVENVLAPTTPAGYQITVVSV
jgi:lysophospholipase L1-like esterase